MDWFLIINKAYRTIMIDLVIMNPPYSVGNKVTSTAIKSCNQCVCLMPISCYKKKSDELWRYVESMDLADPKMFVDADITNNLCICILKNHIADVYRTYQDLEICLYDKKYMTYYVMNKKLRSPYIKDIGKLCVDTKDLISWTDTFVYSERTPDISVGVQGENAADYKFNNSLVPISIDEVAKPRASSGQYTLIATKFPNRTWLNNFVKWYYSDRKNGLARKLVVGLNKNNGTIIDAIPQIDWEAISGTQLWKEGKYDEAVLSEMNLRWNDKKDGVEENI